MDLFFNDTATTEIYTLSLHDALPIYGIARHTARLAEAWDADGHSVTVVDRKSTRLNSSHHSISYAVFCLKKKTLGVAMKPMGAGFIKLIRVLIGTILFSTVGTGIAGMQDLTKVCFFLRKALTSELSIFPLPAVFRF